MYRRIQLIHHITRENGTVEHFMHGLCGLSTDEVAEGWFGLHAPRKAIYKNVRFYFTEAGWEKYGRNTVAACIRSGQDYRVLAVEEHEVDVLFKDEHQVCIRPKRKTPRNNRKRRKSFDM